MDDLQYLQAQLSLAASLLDSAAVQIRDKGVIPVRDNIRHVAEALSEIFEIQRSIYAVRPELTPYHLKVPPSELSKANERLTEVFGNTSRLLNEGNGYKAIELLKKYVEDESSELHLRIAHEYLSKLEKQRDA